VKTVYIIAIAVVCSVVATLGVLIGYGEFALWSLQKATETYNDKLEVYEQKIEDWKALKRIKDRYDREFDDNRCVLDASKPICVQAKKNLGIAGADVKNLEDEIIKMEYDLGLYP